VDRVGFSGRTCGYTLVCVRISHREIEESIRLRGELERSCADLSPRVGGRHHLWYQSLIVSVYFRQKELGE
jgi:hypothetical protein